MSSANCQIASPCDTACEKLATSQPRHESDFQIQALSCKERHLTIHNDSVLDSMFSFRFENVNIIIGLVRGRLCFFKRRFSPHVFAGRTREVACNGRGGQADENGFVVAEMQHGSNKNKLKIVRIINGLLL